MSLEALAHQPVNSTFKGREWTNLGLAKDKLLEEAESLYWAALKLEIAGAALSLHTMLSQDPPFEELSEDSTFFLSPSKRLSTRMLPFIKAWCKLICQTTGYDNNTNSFQGLLAMKILQMQQVKTMLTYCGRFFWARMTLPEQEVCEHRLDFVSTSCLT
jgi:hypothetical protein